MSPSIFTLHQGEAPLLVSLPHDATALPEALLERMHPYAADVPDTDWHVSRLYSVARSLDASVLIPGYSRYLIDLNRPPDGEALYPGRLETGLCPLQGFDGRPLYREGLEPDAAEIQQRLHLYWRPYHEALYRELLRLRERHGRAVLWEGHSIRSQVPMLFDGRLPEFNLGTAAGSSCSLELERELCAVLEAQDSYSWVSNGRFKGGYITRAYGRPEEQIHAVQLELSQITYMNEDSFEFLPLRAAPVQSLIQRLLDVCL